MSLGKQAFKRKYTSEVDFVDEDLEAALLAVKLLQQKRQKLIQNETPLLKAFRSANIIRTPERERIFECLYLQEGGQIFPLAVTAIISEYEGTTNVHDLMATAYFAKKIFGVAMDGVWKNGIYYPKKTAISRTLSRELSFHIASFLGCSEMDHITRKDGNPMSACQEVPVSFCPRARLAFCKDHARIDKKLVVEEHVDIGNNGEERLIPANIHAKHMCNGCWLVCPCKRSVWSDIPLNGLSLQDRPWKCVQCLVTICWTCYNGNGCGENCPDSYDEASTPKRGLCVNCKGLDALECEKCINEEEVDD
jgi:hypothetical protein